VSSPAARLDGRPLEPTVSSSFEALVATKSGSTNVELLHQLDCKHDPRNPAGVGYRGSVADAFLTASPPVVNWLQLPLISTRGAISARPEEPSNPLLH
jgi:hypothetical protein